MATMLRRFLIAWAIATPLVAGFAATAVGSASAAWVEATPSPFDGHREDDAGMTAEQAEEDDTEEEVLRDLLVATTSAAGHAADRVVRAGRTPASLHAAASRCRGPFSRGPPA